jgi:hypothetical protein
MIKIYIRAGSLASHTANEFVSVAPPVTRIPLLKVYHHTLVDHNHISLRSPAAAMEVPPRRSDRRAVRGEAAEYLAALIHETPVLDCPLPRRRHPDPHVRLFDLPSGAEHAARATGPRPRRDIDDAELAVRDGSGGRTRIAARRPLLCAAADRVPDGPILGRVAVSLSPMSSTKTDGASPTGIKSRQSEAGCGKPRWSIYLRARPNTQLPEQAVRCPFDIALTSTTFSGLTQWTLGSVPA